MSQSRLDWYFAAPLELSSLALMTASFVRSHASSEELMSDAHDLNITTRFTYHPKEQYRHRLHIEFPDIGENYKKELEQMGFRFDGSEEARAHNVNLIIPNLILLDVNEVGNSVTLAYPTDRAGKTMELTHNLRNTPQFSVEDVIKRGTKICLRLHIENGESGWVYADQDYLNPGDVCAFFAPPYSKESVEYSIFIHSEKVKPTGPRTKRSIRGHVIHLDDSKHSAYAYLKTILPEENQ